MKKIIKKVTAICLAVLTVFSFVSANNGMFVQNVYAEPSTSFKTCSYGFANGTIKFFLEKGIFYYSEVDKTLNFNGDSVIALDTWSYKDIYVTARFAAITGDSPYIKLLRFGSDAELTLTANGITETVSLLDIIKTSYPNVEGLRYASEPKLSDLKITDSGTKNNEYLSKDSTISIACDYSFKRHSVHDDPLPISEYDINVTVNGVNVPKNSIVIDSQNQKIKVNDLVFAAPRYAMNGKTGTFDVEVSMKDRLGNSSNVSGSIKVDLEAPTIRKITAKWVDGENGKVFIGTEYTGKPTISFTPVEKGSGFKLAKVKDGNTELPLSYTFDFANGLIYTVDFSEYNEVTPVFYVEDANGNIGEYSLSQVLGSAGNTAIKGLPTVDFTMEGGTQAADWYKGNSLTLKATATNNLGGISKVVYKIGNKEEVTSNVSGVTYQFSENVTHLANNNGILDVSVSVYDNNSNVRKIVKQFKIDNVAPVLNNKSISGEYSIYDKIAYVNGELTISGEVVESQSGLNIVKLYKNGILVSNNLPYKITDNGVYSVELVDNAGNKKVYNLSDFFGKDVDRIVVSKNVPSISIESLSGGVKINDIDWYKSLDSVKYSVNCDNLLSTEVKVKNGSSEIELVTAK